jgi:3-hydroxyacyl-[acyl-carrier-protein] dehydratase
MSTRAMLEVSLDHPAFAGHFPAFPVLPGAVVLDETLELIRRERGIDVVRWQLSSAKFLSAVRPGERLTVEHDAPRDDVVRFTIRSEDRIVASGSLSARAARPAV